MNMQVGFKSVLKHPFILVIPVVVQVMISFVLGFGILLGVDFLPASSFSYGETLESSNYQFRLPMVIPLIEDMNQSLSFLPSPGDGNVPLFILGLIVYQAIMSFAIAMYLGSIKKVLFPESHSEQSPFQVGIHYFGRIFIFQIFIFLLFLISLLLVVILPFAILLFFLLIIFSLTPYIIVLEDKRFGEAISDSPKYLKRHFMKFIPLALAALFTTFILSLAIQGLSESAKYYLMLVVYTFIGSGFIAAFMYLLDRCIRDDHSEQDVIVQSSYPRWKNGMMFIIILTLPWLGLKFAYGEHVIAISLQDSTIVREGLAFKSSWSDAFYGSDKKVTTYGFEQIDALELSMSLPEAGSSKESVYGKGKIKWKVDQERISKFGNNITYWGEEVVLTSEFIYRLIPEFHNGKYYYTSLNGGFAKLLKENQPDDPINMEIFVMNGGKDVFVFQYKERFDPQPVIRVDREARYFIPVTSENNPDDYKYFWYTKDPMTLDRLLDFLHTKNKEMMHMGGGTNLHYLEQTVAAFLQEADGDALVRFDEYNELSNLTTNISSHTAEQWTEVVKGLYGDTDLTTFLSYLNKANMQSAYEQNGWEDSGTNEYQLIVPFPKGDITVNCVREDGYLVELEIVLPVMNSM